MESSVGNSGTLQDGSVTSSISESEDEERSADVKDGKEESASDGSSGLTCVGVLESLAISSTRMDVVLEEKFMSLKGLSGGGRSDR